MPDFTKATGHAPADKKGGLNANILTESGALSDNVKFIVALMKVDEFMDELPLEDKNELREFIEVVKTVSASSWAEAKTAVINKTAEDYNNLVDEINKTMRLYAVYKREGSNSFKVKFGSSDGEETYTYENLLKEFKKKRSGQYGHEFSDLINNNSTKSDVYYSAPGKALLKIKKVFHSSSKNGHSIFWDKDDDVYTILAIGKHDDSIPKGLKKGSIYTIYKGFGSPFDDYEGKIIGFKS